MPFTSSRGIIAVVLVSLASSLHAAEPEKFVRFTDEKGGGKLETAVVTYHNDAGVELKLVAAIHIGEKSYFESLAKDFESQDAVLYELVKEKDAKLPSPQEVRRKALEDKDDESGAINVIGKFQRFLKDSLDLEFQLDVIDYTKKNFIHADMDREAFEKAQEERGESFEKLMFRQLLSAMSKPEMWGVNPAGSDELLLDLVQVLTRPDVERQLKTFLAKQMDQMQDAAMGLDGPGGSVILTERNKAAIKVLDETIKSGKKKISLFYGAAHMPDLDKRVREMGFKRDDKFEWKSAWDLRIRADEPSAIEKLLSDFVNEIEKPAESNDAENGDP